MSLLNEDIRPHVTIVTNDPTNELTALVDSGAAISIIHSKYVNPSRISPLSLTVTAASGDKLHVRGQTQMTFRIKPDQHAFEHTFIVVDNLHASKIILGFDFITNANIVIAGKQIFYKDTLISHTPIKTQHLGTITKDTDIPPHSPHLLHIQTDLPNQDVILRQLYPNALPSLHMLDCITTTNKEGIATTIVINTDPTPIQLDEHDAIASAETATNYNLSAINASLQHSFKNDIITPPEPPEGKLPNTPKERQDTVLHLIEPNIKTDSPYWKHKALELLQEYTDTLSENKYDIGHSKAITHKIRLKEPHGQPSYTPQFRIPLAHQQLIIDYCNKLTKLGILQNSTSPFNSPIFAVPKKDLPNGAQDPLNLRVVQDFRKLNDLSHQDTYNVKDARSLIDDIGLAGSTIFSKIDLTSGFWQQELHEDSRPYTAFTVPGHNAKYEFTRVSMGLKGASASFAKLIHHAMAGLDNVLCYIDDILVHTDTPEKHIQVLKQVLLRLRQFGLKANPAKSTIFTTATEYLGYQISKQGVQPSKDKTEAIKNAALPTTLKDIRSFLGLCNYFRHLIPNFARLTEPLIQLTRKNTTWKSGQPLPDTAIKAIKLLKDKLCTEPIVKMPNTTGRYILTTDAATGDANYKGGLGAVLSQVQNGKEHTIAYASRTLKKHEQNYSPFLLEAAAAVFGLESFHIFLLAKHFTLRMDHKPLTTLSTQHKKTLSRLQLAMLTYDFHLEYLPGKDNIIADYLSRSATISALKVEPFDKMNVAQHQRQDRCYAAIIDYINHGTLPSDKGLAHFVNKLADDCFIEDDILWRKLIRKNQRTSTVLMTPKNIQHELLAHAHNGWVLGHAGADKMVARLTSKYWWPGLTNHAAQWVSQCTRCQEIEGKLPNQAPLLSLPIPHAFGDRVHIDLFGPLKTNTANKKYIMVITDALTKYTHLAAIPDKTAETVATAIFNHWIIYHACPKLIITDKGKEFCNDIVNSLCDKFNIKRGTTTPYHPQTNAAAEIFNKTMKKYLTATLDNSNTLEWEILLGPLQLAYNTSVHKTTLESPFYMTHGCDANMPYFDIDKPQKVYNYNAASERFLLTQEAIKAATENAEQAIAAREQYFNKRAKARHFLPGDKILLHTPPSSNTAKNVKFWKPWSMHTIIDVSPNNTVTIKATPHSKPIKVNVSRIKHLIQNRHSKPNEDASTSDSVQHDTQSDQQPIASRTRSKCSNTH